MSQQGRTPQEVDSHIIVIHLWPHYIECAMCGAEDTPGGYAVPWYYQPVREGCSEGGYKSVCKPCFDRWAAWNERT